MSASKLILCFSSHLVAFGLQSSSPPDNITVNPANRKADRRLPEFLTDIGTGDHATLNTEQLISHIRVAVVDTISPLQDSEAGVISVSEECELTTKIHDILDNAVSKWIDNTAHILAYVFNSPFRWCHEV